MFHFNQIKNEKDKTNTYILSFCQAELVRHRRLHQRRRVRRARPGVARRARQLREVDRRHAAMDRLRGGVATAGRGPCPVVTADARERRDRRIWLLAGGDAVLVLPLVPADHHVIRAVAVAVDAAHAFDEMNVPIVPPASLESRVLR